MDTAFKEQMDSYCAAFKGVLAQYLQSVHFRPDILDESMRYSLENGGKRLRPALMFAVARMLGSRIEDVAQFALALEMIHTYSLIHDDLPAMDNDDFRRGKPSCHRQFGEANAILAGDALLNTAFSLLFRAASRGEKQLLAARCLCDAAGAEGMIAGQSADLLMERKGDATAEDLDFIYEHKTAKLIAAPLVMAAILCGEPYLRWEEYGTLLGKLFQLTDDLLDVKATTKELGKTAGKDEREGKLTCVRLIGLSASEAQADLITKRCLSVLEGAKGDVSFFRDLTENVRRRER